MSHRQYPLNSGFGPASTADDVLANIDLRGKNVIVTGGHAGIGLETTRALAKAGASVTVAARDVERATKAISGIERVVVSQLDLVDPKSIEAFAQRWEKRPLHILINNAAVPGSPTLRQDARGFELQFSTSHLGHFQLTLALHEALRAAKNAGAANLEKFISRATRSPKAVQPQTVAWG